MKENTLNSLGRTHHTAFTAFTNTIQMSSQMFEFLVPKQLRKLNTTIPPHPPLPTRVDEIGEGWGGEREARPVGWRLRVQTRESAVDTTTAELNGCRLLFSARV